MTLAAGHQLGPYEIVSPLGAGGMGEVYRPTDTRMDRAYEARSGLLILGIGVSPAHDSLRLDTRIGASLRKIGLKR